MPNRCLPDNLKGKKHSDLIWIMKWIPRSWSAWCGWAWPQPPVLLIGKSGWTSEDRHRFGHHTDKEFERYKNVLPVPKKGHFFISAVLWLKFIPLPFLAWKFKNGNMFSWGVARWDDVDKYYDLHRVRVSGWKGMIVAAIVLAGIIALGYWVLK